MKGKKYVLPLLSAALLCSLVACSEAEEESTYVVPTPGPNSGASQSGTYNASGTPTSQSSGSTAGSTGSTSSSSGSTSGSASFSADSAKTEVLRHAGYTESMIQGYESTEELVSGTVQHNISFWMGIIHYTYVVSGVDGTVLTFNTEFDNNGYQPPADQEAEAVDPNVFVVKEGHVTKDQAKAIAAKDAGVSTNSMVEFVIRNRTTGNINEYEMTFKVGEVEYYYTMLPTTGIITLSRKTEPEPEPEIEIPEVILPSTSTGSSSGGSSSSSGSSSGSSGGATTTPSTTPSVPVVPETSEPEVTEPESTPTEIPDSTVQSSSSSSSVIEGVTGTQSSTASSSATSTATSSTATNSSASESTGTEETTSAPTISSNQAKNIALSQAGVSESSVSSLSILEAKDSTGAVAAYNVSFISGGASHYYSVSATTGAVR